MTGAFRGSNNITDVYYVGSKSDWSSVTYNKYSDLTGVTIHYDYDRNANTESK